MERDKIKELEDEIERLEGDCIEARCELEELYEKVRVEVDSQEEFYREHKEIIDKKDEIEEKYKQIQNEYSENYTKLQKMLVFVYQNEKKTKNEEFIEEEINKMVKTDLGEIIESISEGTSFDIILEKYNSNYELNKYIYRLVNEFSEVLKNFLRICKERSDFYKNFNFEYYKVFDEYNSLTENRIKISKLIETKREEFEGVERQCEQKKVEYREYKITVSVSDTYEMLSSCSTDMSKAGEEIDEIECEKKPDYYKKYNISKCKKPDYYKEYKASFCSNGFLN